MSGQLRRQRIVALLLLLPTVTIFSYLACAASTGMVPAVGGVLVEGVVGTPFAPNPLFADYHDPDRDLVALLFSGLTRSGPQGEPAPDLAERWEVSPDGLVYVFQLRPGVRWHDGEPFTARDVVFTVRLVQNPEFPGNPNLAAVFAGVEVERLDDLTVRFTLSEPFAPFLSYTGLGMLPAHLLQGTAAKDLPASPFRSYPIGTGPFRFKEAALDYVLLEAHTSYHLGRPYLAEVKLRFFPDYASALAALRQGEVQSISSLAPGEVAEIRQDPAWQILSAPRTNSSLIFLNLRSPLFQDRAVRQALTYGLDRTRLIEVAAGGEGMPADSPLPRGTWAHAEPALRQDYEPDRARALLDGAGWPAGPDGVRFRAATEAAGQPAPRLRFTLLTNDDPGRRLLAQEIARQWSDLGVQVDVATAGATGLVKDFLLPRRFDAVLYGLDLGTEPDLYPIWHSSQTSGGGMNLAGYASPEADRLLEQGRQVADPRQRLDIYQQFQGLFVEEVPSLLLYHPAYNYPVDRTIQGIRLGPIDRPASRFANIHEWYIRTKRVYLP